MKLAVVGYWRVSSDRQGRDGVSLDDQAAAGERWCRERGCEMAATFVEDESAWTKRGARRPELARAVSYIREQGGRVRYFLVYDLSRFARNLFDQLRIQRDLEALGVQVTTCTLELSNTAHGRAVAGYLGVTNQLQSDLASEKISSAMLEVVRRGRSPHRAPVGYRNSRDATGAKCVVPDQETAPLIRRAYQMVADGWQVGDVVAELRRLGWKAQRGGDVRPQEIRSILRRPYYAGRVVSLKHGVNVPGTHEAIIDQDTWAKVQARLSGKAVARTPVSDEFPLRGWLVCDLCGAKITASSSRSHTGKLYAYYHCWACAAVRRRKEDVEGRFVEALAATGVSGPDAEGIRRCLIAVWREARGDAAAARHRTMQQLELVTKRRDRLTELLLDNAIDRDVFARESPRLAEEQRRLQIEIAEAVDSTGDLERLLDEAMPLLRNPSNLWLTASPAVKRRIQELIFPAGAALGVSGLRTLETAEIYSLSPGARAAESEVVEQRAERSNYAAWVRAAAVVVRLAA